MAYVYVPDAPGQPQAYAYRPQGQLEQLRAQQSQAYQQQPQTSSGGILWVQGEPAARAYMVAPGNSVLLMDSEAQAFYIKSTDGSGMPLPLRIFDYTERPAQGQTPAAAQPVQAPANDYATRTEMAAALDEIRAQIAALASREYKDTTDGRQASKRLVEPDRGHGQKGAANDGKPSVQPA